MSINSISTYIYEYYTLSILAIRHIHLPIYLIYSSLTHTHIYIYVCMCVCVYTHTQRNQATPHFVHSPLLLHKPFCSPLLSLYLPHCLAIVACNQCPAVSHRSLVLLGSPPPLPLLPSRSQALSS